MNVLQFAEFTNVDKFNEFLRNISIKNVKTTKMIIDKHGTITRYVVEYYTFLAKIDVIPKTDIDEQPDSPF